MLGAAAAPEIAMAVPIFNPSTTYSADMVST